MFDIELNHINYLKISYLLEVTGIHELKIEPIEAKFLFDIDEELDCIGEFSWVIPYSYVSGSVSDQPLIYPPELLVSNYIDEVNEYPNPLISASVGFFANKLTANGLLTKIQNAIDSKFELLSTGQCKTIVKRYLGIALNSAERNNITKMNTKLDNCRTLINTFHGLISKKFITQSIKSWQANMKTASIPTRENISSINKKLHFLCLICSYAQDLPEGDDPITQPIHHERPMVLNWNTRLSAREAMIAREPMVLNWKTRLSAREVMMTREEFKEKLKKRLDPRFDRIINQKNVRDHQISLYCTTCRTFSKVDDKLLVEINRSSGKIKLPFHHGKEMEIRIGKQIPDDK